MKIDSIISIICAILTLIATIVIAIIQYNLSKRMENLSLRQDEENNRRRDQYIKAKSDAFIMKYKNDKDEIYLLPLCWIASIYDSNFSYYRKMYLEYNMLEEDVQNAVCKRMNFRLEKPAYERDEFFDKCVEIARSEEEKYHSNGSYRTILYDNAKYWERAMRYSSKSLPINLFKLEKQITKLLRDYKENPNHCSNPLEQFLESNRFRGDTDEIKACEICNVMIKSISIRNDDIDTFDQDDDYWLPVGCGIEEIETMEDLFLCTLFYVYVCLLISKKEER